MTKTTLLRVRQNDKETMEMMLTGNKTLADVVHELLQFYQNNQKTIQRPVTSKKIKYKIVDL